MTETSITAYEFLAGVISDLTDHPSPRVLDFGCGKAQLVSMGLAKGLDIWGADTFGYSGGWKGPALTAGGKRVVDIVDGKLPFPDGHFDLVIANMVFEHVHDPLAALKEIARVLKPRGRFLALFPTYETWFEGHLGLYFPHWLQGYPALQRAYLRALFALGFGFKRGSMTSAAWADMRQKAMGTSIVYHRERQVMDWWRSVFGKEPRSLAPTYMRSRMRRLGRLPDWLLSAICRRRVGLVLLAERIPATQAAESAAKAAR